MNPEENPSPEAEALESALNAMQSEKGMRRQTLSPELKLALKLKAATHEPKLGANMDSHVEKLLLSRFGHAPEQAPSLWTRIFGSTLVGSAIVAVLAVMVFLKPDLSQGPTLAEVQDFESLSEAEILLGQLPADTLIEENLTAAQLRENIHEINLAFTETDVTLDAETEVGEFPHTELRDSALEIIETQLEIEEVLLARVEPVSSARTFQEKVSKWPTLNEGVDFPTHAKAVSSFLKNHRDWESDMEELAKLLLQEVK